MSSDRFDNNKNLPPWLRGVPLPPKPRDPEARPASQAATPQPPAGEPVPDRLSSSSAEPPAAPPAPALPPWLSDESWGAPPEAPADQAALPDWLRDIQGEAPAAPMRDRPAEQLPGAGGPRTSDWMRDMAGETAPEPSAGPAESSTLPDWLRDAPRAAEPPSEQAPLPSWLSDMTAPAEPSGAPANSGAPPSAGQAQLPSWLQDLATPADQPTASDESASEERPSWPQDLADKPPAQPTLPSWLLDQNDAPILPAPEPSAPPAASEPPDRRRESYDTMQMPAWLQDERTGPSTPEPGPVEPAPPFPPPAPAQAEPAVPSWLRDVSPAAEDAEISAEPFSFEGVTGEAQPPASPDLPDWLKNDADAAGPADILPSWLHEAVDEEPDRAAGGTAAPEAPLWLQDAARDAAGARASETPPAPGEPAEPTPQMEQPSWLQSGEESAPADEGAPSWLSADQPAAAAEDVPAWLRDLRPSEPPLSPPATPPPASSDVPAWLRETPATEPPADVPQWLQEAPAAEPAAEEIPPWLREPSATEAPGAAPPVETPPPSLTPTPAPTSYDDLPEWLRPSAPAPSPAEDVPPWLRDEAGQPLPTAGAPGDAGLPEWLRGAPVEASPAAGATPPPAPAPSARRATAADELAGIELPPWLRPPDQEPPKEEISPADARSLDWLTRLGGHEEDEAVVAPAPLPKLTPPPAPARSAAQVEALALLQRLAANPFPEAAPAPAAEPRTLWRRLRAERLLYLVLLAAVVIALMLPAPEWLGLAGPPAAPGAADMFAQIDRLGENDIVLVGYEWDARRSGELRPLEQAVMNHLIQRKVKLVLVSTDPQGTLLLFDLRDRLAAAGYRPGGQDYILLGYKPGAELALRSLAQDFSGVLRSDFRGNDATTSGLATDLKTGQPRLKTLGDLSMILVLADEPSDVQGWMEQVHPSALKQDGSYVPFGFLLPAEATPIAQPYLTLPGIYHVASKQGALAYQQLRGGSDMPAAQIAAETMQQRLTLLAYITLFVVGAITVGIASVAARRRA